MTTPAIFEGSNYFRQTIGITSTATMVTDFRAVAVTSAGWSEPSTKLFKSPVDADGRFCDVLLTETSTTRLGWRVRDQNAVTICDREIVISGTVTVDYYAGQHFAGIVNITGSEYGFAFMLSEEPESQVAHANYTVGNATRTTASASDGLADTGELFALDNGAAAQASRIIEHRATSNTDIPLKNRSGALRFIPIISQSLFDATNRRVDGALYNAVLCDSASFSFADIVTLSIGNAGETGDFKCIPTATINGLRQMWRKGTTV